MRISLLNGPHPLQRVVMQAFEQDDCLNPTKLARFMARTLRGTGFAAYRTVAFDVLGYMAGQALLSLDDDGWYRKRENTQFQARVIRWLPNPSDQENHFLSKIARKRSSLYQEDGTPKEPRFVTIRDGHIVLRRDSKKKKTEPCHFCLKEHVHGIDDGHRVGHCLFPATIETDAGTFSSEDGYFVVSERKEAANER